MGSPNADLSPNTFYFSSPPDAVVCATLAATSTAKNVVSLILESKVHRGKNGVDTAGTQPYLAKREGIYMAIGDAAPFYIATL